MKVTKKGNIPADQVWEGKCDKCESTMEEIARKLNIRFARDSREKDHAKAGCPVCGEDFTLYATARYEDNTPTRQSNQADSTMVNDR